MPVRTTEVDDDSDAQVDLHAHVRRDGQGRVETDESSEEESPTGSSTSRDEQASNNNTQDQEVRPPPTESRSTPTQVQADILGDTITIDSASRGTATSSDGTRHAVPIALYDALAAWNASREQDRDEQNDPTTRLLDSFNDVSDITDPAPSKVRFEEMSSEFKDTLTTDFDAWV